MNTFKIVYGLFYQPTEAICAAMGIEGADELGLHDFHGTLEFVNNSWHGRLKDKWGWSTLTGILLEPEWRFEFTKIYDRRQDTIRYTLQWSPSNLLWEGDWVMSEGRHTIDVGGAHLYLIDSFPGFFSIPS